MASPKSGNKARSSSPHGGPARRTAHKPAVAGRPSPLAQQLPLVSGSWLLWSLVGVFGGGLALVYLTMVLLFWQGQWQLLFHPLHTEQAVPATIGLPLQDVAFDATQTGQPQLDGWFVPATHGARYSNTTILYLHSLKTGSLADAVPELTRLHQLDMNLFALDYRGYGKSAFLHPSEATTTADVEAAWKYLVETRHLPAHSLVIYGVGLAASLAAEAVANHPDAAAVIFDTPEADALTQLRADPRSHWMPVRLLAHDVFRPDTSLTKAKQPKLILVPDSSIATGRHYAESAADPKLVVYMPFANRTSVQSEAIRRFLDELPATTP